MATRKPAPVRKPGVSLGEALARSVMSRPLNELIQRELALAGAMPALLDAAGKEYQTAVVINPRFNANPAEGRQAVQHMLDVYAEAHPELRGKKKAAIKLFASGRPDVLVGTLSERVIEYLWGSNADNGNPIDLVWPARWHVIIDINLKFRDRIDRGTEPGTITAHTPLDDPIKQDPRVLAKRAIIDAIALAKQRCHVVDPLQVVDNYKTAMSDQYVFARLEGRVLRELVRIDRDWGDEASAMAQSEIHGMAEKGGQGGPRLHAEAEQVDPRMYRAVHQIWPDFPLQRCVHRSARTVKADAAHNSFGASGEGITWAVVDSGVDWRHPHFAMHGNVDRTSPFHRDFTGAGDALVDQKGHGTHVAGIIAGQQIREQALPQAPAPPYDADARLMVVERERDGSNDDTTFVAVTRKELPAISGIAPRCKIVSLKVLDEFGQGRASSVISAIGHIQLLNGYGRDLKIHGINLSLGHNFDPEWFACGHSPLCVEVNRLVRSGVVVVIASGNTGYGVLKTMEGDRNSSLGLSINDPGNAELAITVGATHRDAPHMYGVSYFSSKGPTGDGRCKPDLIAPGERIVSAAAADSTMARQFIGKENVQGSAFSYCEASGTSMAAPHVSGAVAAFLSIRNEFIGEAEKVKKIFMSSATDLGREKYFQGAGLVDLLRAIQSV